MHVSLICRMKVSQFQMRRGKENTKELMIEFQCPRPLFVSIVASLISPPNKKKTTVQYFYLLNMRNELFPYSQILDRQTKQRNINS